ncbi:ATP-binding protein [Leptolinea tardivitalis]|uniref:Rad50/SbcC-type AAA domain-containing protein n=2 Tax=Leptolinea tardivitalis TaxID=229920 RepID=A0A0N8GME7_9CHLR|nr:hypothetical protein [Leptolinea tardivitalis]KPL75090.1 hypothetical protein ADM99_00230 [Leptolinea tardivitalis]GAP20441.1 hypothetical protein LTAR_00631 [Leptolinea tardivitalis]
MPVHITEISLDGLPPQPEIHLRPRRVNLIYGRNEHGKTRLVEFILSSLLRSSSKMTLRPVEAAGFVTVSGLPDAEETRFNPRSRSKLEDYLPAPDAGLPPQLARLLVVKGAENALQANTPGGLGRAALKDYLSNQGVIDRIQDRVPKTTRQAQVTDGRIVGPQNGDLKKRKENLDKLAMIDRLFAEIDAQLSDGPLGQLSARLVEVQEAAAGQKTARQQYVNRLAVDLARWQQESDALPGHEVLHLDADIREEQRLKEEIDRLTRSCREKMPLQADYHWLEAALQTYRAATIPQHDEPVWLYPVLAAVSVVATVLLAFFEFPWAALVTALAALLTGYLAYRRLRSDALANVIAPENRLIMAEFERRFHTRCSGITDLQMKKTSLEQEISLLKTQTELLKTGTERLQDLSREIEHRLTLWLPDWRSVAKNRQAALQILQDRRTFLENSITRVQIALKSSPVQPVPGGETARADEFNPQVLVDLEEESTRIKEKMEDLNRQKTILRQRICDVTGESVTRSLAELIPALQSMRMELEHNARAQTAEILAGIAVTQAAQELRAGEDTALQTALNNPVIREPIHALTGRYERVDLVEDRLDVSDSFQSFRLDELSTGAQEQVLLGLRIGMASRLFEGQPLFLILDDAFQHSDWLRRPAMVDEVLRLAQTGWQVFYLTMDDHLRDLFLEKTPPLLGDDFMAFTMKE